MFTGYFRKRSSSLLNLHKPSRDGITIGTDPAGQLRTFPSPSTLPSIPNSAGLTDLPAPKFLASTGGLSGATLTSSGAKPARLTAGWLAISTQWINCPLAVVKRWVILPPTSCCCW